MEQAPQPSMWQCSTTRRFFRWVSSPRTRRRGLVGLAWAVTLIALCYGIADWRGRHAWNTYRQNYESHVASLEFQTYIPKPVPEAENFAATPFVQSFFVTGPDYSETNFLFGHDDFGLADRKIPDAPPKNSPLAHTRHFMDLVAWQQAFAAVRSHSGNRNDRFQTDKFDAESRAKAAPGILEGLEDDDAALNELHAASSRPEARYPVVYKLEDPYAILLPHLARIKGTCSRLELRACAELALGQGDRAFADVKLIFYLADSLKPEPFIISYLVRLACIHIAIQPVWEGLAEHRWSAVQLQELQAKLQPYDFLADLENPLHAERAVGVLTVDLLKKNGLGMLARLTDAAGPPREEPVLDLLGRMIPSGWYDQEKLQYCRLSEHQLAGAVEVPSKRVYPRQIALRADEFAKMGNLWQAIIRHQLVARILLPAMTKLPPKAAMAQTATDEAAIACALERYRLANGRFPEDLAALVPQWMARLPNDMITGEPDKYRRTAEGLFILYAVGWNEKDDGGTPGKTLFDTTQGDWVW